MADATIVAGLPIPSTSPLFLAGVGIHVADGLTCVVAGVVAMLSRKQPGRHPQAGRIYYGALVVVVITAAALAVARWAEDADLFLLACFAFVLATFGRAAMRRGWLGRYRPHIIAMGGSYIVVLTAFYVDNGKNLPVWRNLPPLAYWTAPAAVGLPIIAWALWRHRLLRRPS